MTIKELLMLSGSTGQFIRLASSDGTYLGTWDYSEIEKEPEIVELPVSDFRYCGDHLLHIVLDDKERPVRIVFREEKSSRFE